MRRRRVQAAWRALLALALLLASPLAVAHQLDSASLTLQEVSNGRFLVKWQAGSSSLQRELLEPAVFPPPCRLKGAYLECGANGLNGAIAFPWLQGTLTHVMLDIEWQGHARLLRSVTAGSPSVNVYGAPVGGLGFVWPIATDYTALGVEHIAAGFDHLLFVVALTLLVRGRRALVATISAFTLAHSISLAATVLGVIHLPAPPVEAAIALSIVLVCVECLGSADSFTRRAPWLVAFGFGLLHGLGFASALLELGLPEQHVALALLFFNVGVELGQLAVIALVASATWLVVRAGLQKTWLRPSVIYAMGALGACWSLQRVLAVFGV